MLLSAPTLAAISNVTVNHSSPLIIGLDGFDADNDNLTYTVSVTGTNPTHLTTEILGANDGVNYNRSLVLETSMGTMVFELFEDLVPDATQRIIDMVTAGYYDGLSFHRVINDFVIQTGSYTYNSGYVAKSSSYTSFDDQFSVDLQHNATGLLSWAKRTPDDSASTDFFITDLNAASQTSVNNLRNLDYNYSIFGKIVEGATVLANITNVATATVSGLSNAPTTPVIITDARIETNEQNATLMLKVADNYTEGEQVTVTVTADDGNGGTVQRQFIVTLQSDSDDVASQITQTVSGETISTSYSENVNNSDPYIATMAPVIMAYGTNTVTISGISYDVDGYKTFIMKEYQSVNGQLLTGTATEQVSLAILDSESNLSTSSTDSKYWGNYVDLTRYDISDFQSLPTGLQYTNAKRISGHYDINTGTLTFDISVTRTDSSLVGVYYILLARYNIVESPNVIIGYDSSNQPVYAAYYATGFDTQVVTMILQPPTPTSIVVNNLTSSLTNDNTPSITVTGLTTGINAKVKILDDQDNVVYDGNVTGASMTINLTGTLADGSRTLRAVQYVTNASTGDQAVSNAKTSTAFTVDTTAPQAFTNFALTPATSGVAYSYNVGHPQEDDNSITFLLSGAPAGMTINAHTALISWPLPTDASYPSVTFNIIARDAVGNQTTQQVTLQVNSNVDLSGVVFLDANHNDIADSGEGKGGVIVYADINGNNQLDETDIYAISSTTGSIGSYTLQNVPAGTVVLHQVLADGVQQTSPTDALLTQVQVITDGDAATIDNAATTVDGLTWAGALAMSPDGLYVYATSGSGTTGDDAIAVFARDPNDGTLTYIQLLKNLVGGVTGLDDPNNLTVTPDGRHVYVTTNKAGTSDTLVIFSRDQSNGELTYVTTLTNGGTDALGNTITLFNGVSTVDVSSDSEYVYVGALTSNAVTVFSRNRYSGLLTQIQTISDGTNLAGVWTLTLSPDGKNLYIGVAEGLVVYNVDPATGLLSFSQNIDNATLTSVRSIAITPNGQYLYATAVTDNALNIFTRNTSTGQLTFQSADTNVSGASTVQINTDGTKLFVAAVSDSEVSIYDIQANGTLSLNQSITDGAVDLLDTTISKLGGAVALILDPTGNDLYVASRADNSLTVLSNRTRSWAGTPYLLLVDPNSGQHTGLNFLNEQFTLNVDDVQYNALQFNSDRPDSKAYNSASNWGTQRSEIRDITITFSNDMISVDKTAVQLVRIFDVAGNAITQTVSLNLADILVDGDQLILRNLDLVDGVYELTITTAFNTAMTSEYSTSFHQLLGDFNGDRVFGPADLATLAYWRQASADLNNHVDVPGYLDVRNTLDAPTPDGRVDSHDFAVFVGSFGTFIPQAAVPVPDIILASSNPPSSPQANMLVYANNAPKSASLKLVTTDDDDNALTNGLLDQLDDPNLIVSLLETE